VISLPIPRMRTGSRTEEPRSHHDNQPISGLAPDARMRLFTAAFRIIGCERISIVAAGFQPAGRGGADPEREPDAGDGASLSIGITNRNGSHSQTLPRPHPAGRMPAATTRQRGSSDGVRSPPGSCLVAAFCAGLSPGRGLGGSRLQRRRSTVTHRPRGAPAPGAAPPPLGGAWHRARGSRSASPDQCCRSL